MSKNSKYIYVVAGGTGGHINSALAIGGEAKRRGYEVLYLSGSRPLDLKLYKEEGAVHLESVALRGKSPVMLFAGIRANLNSFFEVLGKIKTKRPRFIVGAGGYVCGPVMLAGFLSGVPLYILEQNSIAGLTNKILALFSKRVFLHFFNTRGFLPFINKRTRVVGNPIRPIFHEKVFINEPHAEQRVLIFGGSLGSKRINEFTYKLIERGIGKPMHIRHQVGQGTEKVELKSAKDITYNALEYIDNIENDYQWADIIISRAGASTVSELRLVKKPVMLVPFPRATDDHQTINALSFQAEVDFPVVILKDSELLVEGFSSINKLIEEEKKETPGPIKIIDASVKILNEIEASL